MKDPYDEYHAIVMSNDYTKNISQSIFTPGILIKDNYEHRTPEAKQTIYSGGPSENKRKTAVRPKSSYQRRENN